MLRPDETLDELRLGGLQIIQAKDGYRFSLDPVLLCAFGRVAPGEAVVDLGCGAGVIALVLARITQAQRVVGIERQPQLAERARRSAALNNLTERVEIRCQDLRQIGQSEPAGQFAAVFANPPFRAPGSGRQAPQAERAAARHELAGGLSDFLEAARYLLGPQGRLYLVYLPERLAELLAEMRRLGLEPKRLRCVHSRVGEPARLVLVEGRKGGRAGLALEAPLLVYDGEGYSAEVLACYGVAPEGPD